MANDQMAAAIKAAFARFALVYGAQAIARMYHGQDVETVKRAWAHELRGCTSLDVMFALEHLGEALPNLMQFKALCYRRPEGVMLKLPTPRVDPAQVKRVVSEVGKVKDTLTGYRIDIAWQDRILARYVAGDHRLTKYQKDICEELLAQRRAREVPYA